MSNYTPFIQKLNFSQDILNEDFDLIKTIKNQPKFNLDIIIIRSR